jgi:hypothetical protein
MSSGITANSKSAIGSDDGGQASATEAALTTLVGRGAELNLSNGSTVRGVVYTVDPTTGCSLILLPAKGTAASGSSHDDGGCVLVPPGSLVSCSAWDCPEVRVSTNGGRWDSGSALRRSHLS